MEQNNKNKFIKMDENIVLNEDYIRWIRKINDCLEICTKFNGCTSYSSHKLCKFNNPKEYNKLNQYFE